MSAWFETVRDIGGRPVPAAVMGLVLVACLVALAAVLAVRRRPRSAVSEPTGGQVRIRLLVGVALVAAVAVAVLAGVRSFGAVSERFGSPVVPLIADGMIVACTALRLAALARGWRLPGSLVASYLFVGGTVWLNVAAAHTGTDAVAHAVAPVSYAVLVEMLAHLLRLHLRLVQSTEARITVVTWVTSPVVTSRLWLHMVRTGQSDPVAARVLVQQVIRMTSRLLAVCPSGRWPWDQARAARAAAVQTVRDGVLTAAELAALLPPRVTPGELLALVDTAALGIPSARAGDGECRDDADGAGRPLAGDEAAGQVESVVARETEAGLVSDTRGRGESTSDSRPLRRSPRRAPTPGPAGALVSVRSGLPRPRRSDGARQPDSAGDRAEDVMWRHYHDVLSSQGRAPTGADLDRAAGTSNYGRTVLRRWRTEGWIPAA